MIDLWAIAIAVGLFLGSAAILVITEPLAEWAEGER